MHLPDALLLRLIGSDQLGNENTTAEEHLAECSTCQSRLAQMSGDSRELQSELSHLRSASQHELELVRSVSGVSIEPGSPSSAARVEVELVDLGFLESPKHPELLGRLGRYDVEKTIGSGGMGIVLKAFDGELNRVVAIKVLAPHLANSGAARARFSREARAAAAVLHPNVLPIFNVESEGRIPYFVMQYIAGQSLQTRVDREGPLDICTALRIAKQTASALQAAHTQGLVHRDVKPANILLEEGGERAQLSDFGLARTADDASLTRTGIVAGTPHYMSPEQANGDSIDTRSDLFSLGCTLYFMLAGRPPFRAESTMAVLNRICHHAHRPLHLVNTSLPRELSRLVDRLLEKRPSKRFESAEAVEAVIDRLLISIQEGRMGILTAGQRRLLNRRLGWIASATAAALIAVAGWNWLLHRTGAVEILPENTTLYQSSGLTTPGERKEQTVPNSSLGNFNQYSSNAAELAMPANEWRLANPVVSTPEPLTEPVEADLRPDQWIRAEDQWRQETRQLQSQIEHALAPDRAWQVLFSSSSNVGDQQVQSLFEQLTEVENSLSNHLP